jgi:putative NADPH-quinone reductase
MAFMDAAPRPPIQAPGGLVKPDGTTHGAAREGGMGSRIVIIEGHPDPRPERLCHALAEAYAAGAAEAGHEVVRIRVAQLDFTLLRSKNEFDHGTVPAALKVGQQAIGAADHLVIVYPLWLGTMPALLKGFLEQVLRPGFAAGATAPAQPWRKLLTGKSARVVVTMGMPALVYRWYFWAHSLKSLERHILKFCGIAPVRESLFGRVDAAPAATRARWLEEMREHGRASR